MPFGSVWNAREREVDESETISFVESFFVGQFPLLWTISFLDWYGLAD